MSVKSGSAGLMRTSSSAADGVCDADGSSAAPDIDGTVVRVPVEAMLTREALIWPCPAPQYSEHAMSYWPGGGATNSTVMGSPPAGIRASIFREGIENPCTTSFDRITSRTDSPAVTGIVAGSNAYRVATIWTSCT